MRHYPAFCTDCRRLWLVATASSPSSSPECPRCKERGRLVPGAYYSDPASVVFLELEAAIENSSLATAALGKLSSRIEEALPAPDEGRIETMFVEAMDVLKLSTSSVPSTGRRVALRMIVTIANARCHPVVKESGVMRLPQTIAGLFDKLPDARKESDGE
jgi:hypothetical protein